MKVHKLYSLVVHILCRLKAAAGPEDMEVQWLQKDGPHTFRRAVDCAAREAGELLLFGLVWQGYSTGSRLWACRMCSSVLQLFCFTNRAVERGGGRGAGWYILLVIGPKVWIYG